MCVCKSTVDRRTVLYGSITHLMGVLSNTLLLYFECIIIKQINKMHLTCSGRPNPLLAQFHHPSFKQGGGGELAMGLTRTHIGSKINLSFKVEQLSPWKNPTTTTQTNEIRRVNSLRCNNGLPLLYYVFRVCPVCLVEGAGRMCAQWKNWEKKTETTNDHNFVLQAPIAQIT